MQCWYKKRVVVPLLFIVGAIWVHLVFSVHCWIQYPRIKGLRVFSLEITTLSIFQENNNWENFSCQCINKVGYHTAERKKNSSENVGGWYSYSLPALVRKWHLLHLWPGQSFGRMTAPYWSLIDQLLSVLSGVVFGSFQFISGFNRPKNELRRIFPFIIYGHQPLKKFHLTIWIIFIHYMQQSLYI